MKSVLWNIKNCVKTYNSIDIRNYLPEKHNIIIYACYKVIGFVYHCSGYLEGYMKARRMTK